MWSLPQRAGVASETLQAHALAARDARRSARLVLRGIVLNALLAGIKFAGGIFGHTYALIADGAESTLDIFSSVLVWTGFRVAALPPYQRPHLSKLYLAGFLTTSSKRILVISFGDNVARYWLIFLGDSKSSSALLYGRSMS